MSNTCSVKVLVRVRPPSSAEINGGAAFKSTLSVRDDGDGSCGGDVTVVNTNECFAFDAVAGEDSTQEKIFSSVGRGANASTGVGFTLSSRLVLSLSLFLSPFDSFVTTTKHTHVLTGCFCVNPCLARARVQTS